MLLHRQKKNPTGKEIFMSFSNITNSLPYIVETNEQIHKNVEREKDRERERKSINMLREKALLYTGLKQCFKKKIFLFNL